MLVTFQLFLSPLILHLNLQALFVTGYSDAYPYSDKAFTRTRTLHYSSFQPPLINTRIPRDLALKQIANSLYQVPSGPVALRPSSPVQRQRGTGPRLWHHKSPIWLPVQHISIYPLLKAFQPLRVWRKNL